MKIKIEKQAAIIEEVEINFPLYRVQQNAFYYRCNSEKDVVCVTDCGHIYGIKKEGMFVENNIFHYDSKEITEREFKDKYEEVLDKLINQQ